MSYQRVIPRDLFNEANLLKCMGRLWIITEGMRSVTFEHDGGPFDIERDDADGSLSVANVRFIVRHSARRLYRPLNSREPWPLYFLDHRGEEVAVFTDHGDLTPEMKAFLT